MKNANIFNSFLFSIGDFICLIDWEDNTFLDLPKGHNDKGDDPQILQGGYTRGHARVVVDPILCMCLLSAIKAAPYSRDERT